ncbi:hypothetical protein EB232_18215 [Mesorhizobium sp. NZP2077]|nr:hypothetical protein EB232_18215 [Mesorhizobium sp. NZP2077]
MIVAPEDGREFCELSSADAHNCQSATIAIHNPFDQGFNGIPLYGFYQGQKANCHPIIVR